MKKKHQFKVVNEIGTFQHFERRSALSGHSLFINIYVEKKPKNDVCKTKLQNVSSNNSILYDHSIRFCGLNMK